MKRPHTVTVSTIISCIIKLQVICWGWLLKIYDFTRESVSTVVLLKTRLFTRESILTVTKVHLNSTDTPQSMAEWSFNEGRIHYEWIDSLDWFNVLKCMRMCVSVSVLCEYKKITWEKGMKKSSEFDQS